MTTPVDIDKRAKLLLAEQFNAGVTLDEMHDRLEMPLCLIVPVVAALIAKAERVDAMTEAETGWLIEVETDDGLRYHMASRTTDDHREALRFARREDAQAFADAFLSDHRRTVAHPQYTRIAEHAWG